jgi:hypothetical protein
LARAWPGGRSQPPSAGSAWPCFTPTCRRPSPTSRRPPGSAIGIYRFWRDLGYAIGALGLGIAAHFTGQMEAAFWFVAVSMALSGGLLFWFGEETHPRLNPAA